MADIECIKFICVEGRALYFQGTACDEDGLLTDTFEKSKKKIKLIKNIQNEFLFVDEAKQFMFAEKKNIQLDNCRFTIQTYDDSIPLRRRAVILSAYAGSERLMVCCSENGPRAGICSTVYDAPETIPEDQHKAVFYLEKKIGFENTYRLESSCFRSWYLGFEPAEGSFLKLILRNEREDDYSLMTIQSPILD